MTDNPEYPFEARSAARPAANRASQTRHKREVFWQITFPVCAAGLLLLAGGVGIGLGPVGSASLGADISLIFVLILTGICVLPLLILIAALAIGVWKINDVLPRYTYLLQGVFLLIQTKVKQGADGAVKPVMGLETRAAALRRIVPAIRGWRTERPHSSSKQNPVQDGARREQ